MKVTLKVREVTYNSNQNWPWPLEVELQNPGSVLRSDTSIGLSVLDTSHSEPLDRFGESPGELGHGPEGLPYLTYLPLFCL